MTKNWDLLSLDKLLTRRKDEIYISELEEYKRITIKSNGQGIVIRDRALGNKIGTKKQFIARHGQLVMSKIDARNGAFGILPEDCDNSIITGNFWAFDINKSLLDSKYFDYLTKTPVFVEFCIKSSDGTTNRRYLQEDKFLSMKISLPPIEEQRRIVAKVEELAGKIEEARSLREQTNKLTKAFFTSASTKILSKNSINGYLSDVLLEKPKNGWSPRRDDLPTGIPVLSLGAVTGFDYNGTEFKRTSESVDENAHYWLKKGDLLITRSNSPELVGHAAIYDGNPYPCIYPDLMMRLEIDESKADKRFVHFWLTCTPVRDYIKRNAKGTSPSMKKISQGVVIKIPFPVDISLPEQKRIVNYLDRLQSKVDEMKRLREKALHELDALLPSILDKAFKGEL